MQELEKVNRGLEEGTRKLRHEMEGGQEEMERMADEYEKMRKVISGSDKFADDLQRQNAKLKMQVYYFAWFFWFFAVIKK